MTQARPAAPTVANDEREAAWRLFIETSTRVAGALDDQLRTDAQMSLSDYHVMLLLHEAPEQRLRMKDLAARMVFSASRLTYQVDVLCRRGWLRREPVPSDRRGSYAILTDAGHAAFAAAGRGHFDLVQQIFYDVLTPEDGRTLAAIMTKIDHRLDDKERP
ncbi:putative MarR family transcriptional regulator [Gordonia hirsuta DSM 44140 = NBRC 16056]|uniref:Putative MarR family transcriptional regulator n=1 Tax=Gordonia hirsuta DSM 44140 = NBRC 16056 TaxID=1121927 RepID=L7LE71_9ACTN|nr:MarR family transcriptional regulator [Gordonia hirsuta]GAC58367.1 putative MarR family transcriptional regulator [Gordonia hirsuta DSM 44140 = NBRC 16056]